MRVLGSRESGRNKKQQVAGLNIEDLKTIRTLIGREITSVREDSKTDVVANAYFNHLRGLNRSIQDAIDEWKKDDD